MVLPATSDFREFIEMAMPIATRARSITGCFVLSATVLAASWAFAAGSHAAVAVPAGQPSSQQSGDVAPASQPITAVVSIPPLRGLIEPMLPGGSALDVLIPPGVSEHGYEVPPRKLAQLNKADLVVLVGLGLEPSVEEMLKDRPVEGRIVVTFEKAAAIDAATAPKHECEHEHHDAHDHSGHDHSGHEHDEHGNCVHHDHGGQSASHAQAADPHLWLDPVLCKALVERVADELIQREAVRTGRPITSDHPIARSRDELLSRLTKLDGDYRALADSAGTKTIVVGHDAYGWLAKRYGFETIAIAGLNAAEPTPKAIGAAIEAIKAKGVRIVFVEPQLNQSAGRRIAKAAGAEVRVLDPLGDGDYFKLMERNLVALREAMKPAEAAAKK